MAEHGTKVRDVARLDVARVGKVEETGDRLMPFRLLDGRGVEMPAVTGFCTTCLLTTPVRRRCGPTPTNCCPGTGSCTRWMLRGIWLDAWRPVISRCGSRLSRSRRGSVVLTRRHQGR